jgi:hypothetical protein
MNNQMNGQMDVQVDVQLVLVLPPTGKPIGHPINLRQRINVQLSPESSLDISVVDGCPTMDGESSMDVSVGW